MINAKANIVILATGGTIAGESSSELKTTGYKAGILGVDILVDSVPKLRSLATITIEQIDNIDSADMNDCIWLKLANRINSLLCKNNIDGIVVTHGTDTMEESAYFLNLVVKSSKPVVLTGAMRPATSMSADGVKNLYNAVALAISKDAFNKGVMVVMNDRIFSSRDVSKTHTSNIDAFKGVNSGEMGYIIDGVVYFNTITIKPHTNDTPFDVRGLNNLPKVDIVYTYTNDGSKVALEAFVNSGSKGIVVAGSGGGSIHKNQRQFLEKLLAQKKINVVKSSRVGAGLVVISDLERKQGFISANNLNPQKARVLLMLSLTKTNIPSEIERYFEIY